MTDEEKKLKAAERSKQWRKNNHDKVLGYQRRYAWTHPEKMQAHKNRAVHKRKLRKAIDKASSFPLYFQKQVARLLAMGKDEVTIALRLGIPISSIRQFREANSRYETYGWANYKATRPVL